MDWYSIVKFLHVFSAILWLGGGFTMLIIGTRAELSGDAGAILSNLKHTAALGNVLFVPASMGTLIFGVLLAWVWTGFSDLWLIIGLAGAASTFLTGVLFIKPTADKMVAMGDKDGATPAALQLGRRILQIAKFDYAVMVVIVADMVLKPGPADYPILGAMAVLVLAAAILFLLPRGDDSVPAAA